MSSILDKTRAMLDRLEGQDGVLVVTVHDHKCHHDAVQLTPAAFFARFKGRDVEVSYTSNTHYRIVSDDIVWTAMVRGEDSGTVTL